MKLVNSNDPPRHRSYGAAIQGRTDFIERAPGRLKSLDLKKTLEMRLAVVRPSPNAERRRNQPLLNVVPHRATGDISQGGQVLNGIPGIDSH